MREHRSPNTRLRARIARVAAVPTAALMVAAALPGVAPQAQAQLSSGSSTFGDSRGLSDAIRPKDPPARTPIEVDEHPQVPGLPDGVSVDRIEWLTNRRVAVFIKSAAMPDQLMQVQILLARDWHQNPDAKFPEVWALDGLRARDDENGWTIETNIEQFYADKNVNVILPVGGESSFYATGNSPTTASTTSGRRS